MHKSGQRISLNTVLFILVAVVGGVPTAFVLIFTVGTPSQWVGLVVAGLSVGLTILMGKQLTRLSAAYTLRVEQVNQQVEKARRSLEQQTINLVLNTLSMMEYRNRLEDRNQELQTAKQNLEEQNYQLIQNARSLENYQRQLEARNKELQAALVTKQALSESLAAEKQQMSTLLESLTDGVVAVDETARILIFNTAAEQITGLSRQSVVGKHIDEGLQFYRQEEGVLLEEYTKQDEEMMHELWRSGLQLHRGEQMVSVALTSAPVKFADGQSGWIISFHDITKERELEAMKVDFVSMAAHELRTPLTTVQGYIALLQMPDVIGKLAPEEQGLLAQAAVGAMRLGKLIENLLVVSRIEGGRLKLELQEVNLAEIVKKCVQELQVMAKDKGLQLIFDKFDQEVPVVQVDTSRIEEVISNLVSNAIKYTNEGRITVQVQREGEFVVTKVEDTGLGIKQEDLTHLFTKFYRAKGELRAQAKGTGLGLYISKKIVEQHGGKIWVERSTLGKGSMFAFSVPINKTTNNKQQTTNN